jgi:cellulose biosynthesis protein BcsQ
MATRDAEPIFVDTNVLVYAHVAEAPWHQEAQAAIVDHEAAGAPQLKAALEQLAQAAQTTLVVVDCPLELSDPALVAALLADVILVQVTPSPLDLWAAKQAVATAQEARTLRDGRKPLTITLPLDMLRDLRLLGLVRRAEGAKSTCVSELVREAIHDLLERAHATEPPSTS